MLASFVQFALEKIGSAKSASQRAIQATVRAVRANFASIFFLRLVWEVIDHFTKKHLAPDYH